VGKQRQADADKVGTILSGLLLAPAVLPLLYVPGFLFPYAAPKSLAFRGMGVLLLATLAWSMLSSTALYYQRLKQPATWIPAVLLLVEYVTSLLGFDFYHGFWSSLERGDGLLTHSTAVLFFYGVLLHADGRYLRRLAEWSTWVSALVTLVALLQWLHAAVGVPLPVSLRPSGRIGSTFGNAAFMASYLGMALVLTLWVSRQWSPTWRWLANVVVGLQLCAILISGTRGTILALLLAGLLAAGYVSLLGRGRTRLVARAVLIGFVALAGAGLLFRDRLAEVPVAVVQRLATMSPTSGTGGIRLALWESIGREALKRPLSGVGAEQVEYLYNVAYTTELIAGEWNDRSHNAYLDYFAQFGVAGAVLYLMLVAAALDLSRRALRKGEVEGGYLFLLVTVYSAQNVFVFDTALSLWMFLVVLGSLLCRMKAERQCLPWTAGNRLPSAVLSVAIIGLLLPVVIQPARASVLIADSVSNHALLPRQQAVNVTKGMALGTYADREYGYNTYNMYSFRQDRVLQGDDLILAHRTALGVLRANFGRYPHDVRTALYLAHVIDRTPPGVVPDLPLLDKATSAVRAVSPNRPAAWYYRANAEIRQGDAATTSVERDARYKAAIGILGAYADRQPRLATPHFAIANLYSVMGDLVQARQWASSGEVRYRSETDNARAAAGYYLGTSDWARAAKYLGELITLDPVTRNQTYHDLAMARWLAGDVAGAAKVLDQLRESAPGELAMDPELWAQIEAARPR
jgi:O-antigen ligase